MASTQLMQAAWVALLLWSSGCAAVARLQWPDASDFKVTPGLPTAYQASSRFQNNYLATIHAANEKQAAADRLRASVALESAARSELMATSQRLEAQEAGTLEMARARKLEAESEQARTVLEQSLHMLDMIPEIAKRAVQRAVKDVEQETIQKLNAEVAQVVAAQTQQATLAREVAADAAQRAALPYQLGKLKAQQSMVAYTEKGRELASAAGEIRKRALEVAQASLPLQKVGDVAPAQQLQLEARDLLDKADQLEAQAKAVSQAAGQIQAGLQGYDGAAKAAAAYGAYQANAAEALDGPQDTSFPRPPFPLVLPTPQAGGGAPGPAPAPATP